MREIGEGIHYEDIFPGVTLGALTFPKGVVLIDAPLRPEDTRIWRSMLINQPGWTNRVLVNLDAHPDRTLGARVMETTIVAHQNAARIFDERTTIFKGQPSDSGSVWETFRSSIGTRWMPPDITFTDRMVLHWSGADVVIEHHPSSSPESIWVFIPEEQVVFVGDTILDEQPPFLARANLERWIQEIDLLLKTYENYSIVCGRGGLADRDMVRRQLRFLKTVNGRLEKLAAREALPEATARMVPSLLKKFSIPDSMKDVYSQRLQHGLYHCYTRSYLPSDGQG